MIKLKNSENLPQSAVALYAIEDACRDGELPSNELPKAQTNTRCRKPNLHGSGRDPTERKEFKLFFPKSPCKWRATAIPDPHPNADCPRQASTPTGLLYPQRPSHTAVAGRSGHLDCDGI